jgi:hypothetical protein
MTRRYQVRLLLIRVLRMGNLLRVLRISSECWFLNAQHNATKNRYSYAKGRSREILEESKGFIPSIKYSVLKSGACVELIGLCSVN